MRWSLPGPSSSSSPWSSGPFGVCSRRRAPGSKVFRRRSGVRVLILGARATTKSFCSKARAALLQARASPRIRYFSKAPSALKAQARSVRSAIPSSPTDVRPAWECSNARRDLGPNLTGSPPSDPLRKRNVVFRSGKDTFSTCLDKGRHPKFRSRELLTKRRAGVPNADLMGWDPCSQDPSNGPPMCGRFRVGQFQIRQIPPVRRRQS